MRFILASRSERRAALLKAEGWVFEAMDPPFIDPPTPQSPACTCGAAHAVELARQKAQSLRPLIEGDAILLAADTICVAPDGRLVGTPETRAEAEAILRSFISAAHDVVTGVALLRTSDERWWHESDIATVTWGQIADDAIEPYLASGEWRGKAGAYNLFDRQRAGWPIRVDGDPTTVVGLPIRKVMRMLEQAGAESKAARP